MKCDQTNEQLSAFPQPVQIEKGVQFSVNNFNDF